MIFAQPFLGGAVVVLCTAIVIYQRRHDLLAYIKHDHGVNVDGVDGVDTWQSAHAALMTGKYSESVEGRLLEAIKQNETDGRAQLALADLAFFGSAHHEPDYERAFQLYQQVYEEHGLSEAAHMLALYYAEGLGVPVNQGKALVLYTIAAKAGYLPSQLTLAHWYSSGIHVANDCATARSHLFAAAAVVNEELSRRKRKYRSVVPPESIVEREQRSDVLSMFPSRDLIEYYRYSADRGQIESQTILGQVHYHGGADWDPDYEQAFKFFKAAAIQGGAVAQGYLGQMYLRGEYVQQSNQLAYKHFKASAEGGSAMGLNGMGMCYWRGIEVVQDYEEAWDFFDKAVAKDHPDALYNVAMMLKEWNQPLLADSIVSYLMKAVKNGHLLAHYELARTYNRQPGFCSLSTYLLKTFVEKCDQAFIVMDQAHSFYKRNLRNQAVSRYLFMAGQGFEIAQNDDKRAVVWWNRSSMQGNFRSRIRVGDFFYSHFKPYALGKAAAAAHYLSAALHKTPQASYNMALCYKFGRGVPKDADLSELFMLDALRYDKTGKAKWPVYITQRLFAVSDWLRKYGPFVMVILGLWLMIFSVLLAAMFMYEHHQHNRNRPRQ